MKRGCGIGFWDLTRGFDLVCHQRGPEWNMPVHVMKMVYLPASNAGEARGESSVEMVKMPSNFRSG